MKKGVAGRSEIGTFSFFPASFSGRMAVPSRFGWSVSLPPLPHDSRRRAKRATRKAARRMAKILDEQRVVRRRSLTFRTAGRVVVERNRLAGDAGRRRQRVRMAVKRRITRREDHGAVEERRDLLPARGAISIPQLELPAPF